MTTLKIKAQDTYYVYVSSDTPLAKGALILFDEKITGIVYLEPTVAEPDVYTVRIYDDTTVTSARVKQWWAPLHPKTSLIVPETFFGEANDTATLQVPCRLPEDHRPGLLGWTLYYQTDRNTPPEAVISGNDLHSPGRCTYSHSGQWPIGIYTLKAASYSSVASMPRREASVDWIVDESTTTLWCAETNSLNLT